jgi:hypothetical protein
VTGEVHAQGELDREEQRELSNDDCVNVGSLLQYFSVIATM